MSSKAFSDGERGTGDRVGAGTSTGRPLTPTLCMFPGETFAKPWSVRRIVETIVPASRGSWPCTVPPIRRNSSTPGCRCGLAATAPAGAADELRIDWAPLAALVAGSTPRRSGGRVIRRSADGEGRCCSSSGTRPRDPAMEEALWERLSFRRSRGVGAASPSTLISRTTISGSARGWYDGGPGRSRCSRRWSSNWPRAGCWSAQGTLVDQADAWVDAQVRRPTGEACAARAAPRTRTRRGPAAGPHARFGYKLHRGWPRRLGTAGGAPGECERPSRGVTG